MRSLSARSRCPSLLGTSTRPHLSGSAPGPCAALSDVGVQSASAAVIVGPRRNISSSSAHHEQLGLAVWKWVNPSLQDGNFQKSKRSSKPNANSLVKLDSIISNLAKSLKVEREIPTIRPWSLAEYQFQSSVNHGDTPGARLVDTAEHQDNYTLWVDLLRFRQKYEGHAGSWEIFLGMRSRHVDLPVDGVDAKSLWEAFVSAGLRLDTVDHVLDHAQELFQRDSVRYVGLYDVLVGKFLKQAVVSYTRAVGEEDKTASHKMGAESLESARQWHSKLQKLHLPEREILHRLVPVVIRHSKVLQTFKHLYLQSNVRDLYDSIIPQLWDAGKRPKAVSWHRFLISHGDTTKVEPNSESVTPFKSSAWVPITRVHFPRTPNNVGYHPCTGAYRIFRPESRSEPLTISDDYPARAVATKALNLSFVISSLAVFGVKMVGRLTIQALGLRCRGVVSTAYDSENQDYHLNLANEIASQLKILKTSGVGIEHCEYTRIVQQLAYDKNGRLLDAIITSDLHPDVYEDRNLQLQIFDSYVHSRDMTQALSLLEILALPHRDPSYFAWNKLLQAHIKSPHEDRWSKISQTFDSMLVKGISLSHDSRKQTLVSLLSPRYPSKRPVVANDQKFALHFTINLWVQSMMPPRELIEPGDWREIHKRLGMLGHLGDLEHLILWQGSIYGSQVESPNSNSVSPSGDSAVPSTTPSQRNLGRSPIDRLFPPLRQAAIIEWYFKSLASPPSPKETTKETNESIVTLQNFSTVPHVEQWARGVALLLKLKRHGLSVDTATVRRICRKRLSHLFSNEHQPVIQNRLARANNTRSLRYMVSYLQHLWKPTGLLFAVPDRLLEHDSEEAEVYLRDHILEQSREFSRFYRTRDFPDTETFKDWRSLPQWEDSALSYNQKISKVRRTYTQSALV